MEKKANRKKSTIYKIKRRWPIQLRILSMVLALSMVLTSSGMQVLAKGDQSDEAATETVVEQEAAAQGKEAAAKAKSPEEETESETEPETTAPEKNAPETSAPKTSAPETSAPETTAPETTAPETSAPETTAPETAAPEPSASETTAPETSAPETVAPEPGVSETTAPETVAPETSASESTASETSVPETTAPETAAPETSASETTAPEASVSETTAPETAASEPSASETTAPEMSAPETAAPETSASETTTPETTASETSAPETTVPETMVSETGAPETIESETTAPETTALETSVQETTAPETNASETSNPETEVSETSAPETTAANEDITENTVQPETTAADNPSVETSVQQETEETEQTEFVEAPAQSMESGESETTAEPETTERKKSRAKTTEVTEESETESGSENETEIESSEELLEEIEEEEAADLVAADAGESGRLDLAPYIKAESTMKITINGIAYTLAQIQAKGLKVPQGAPVEVQLKFEDIPGVKDGMVLYYQVPEEMTTGIHEKHEGVIKDGSTYAGTYSISTTGLIELYPDSAYLAKTRDSEGNTTLKNGMVTFSGSLSSSHGSTPGDNDEVIQYGPATFIIPFEYPNINGKVEITKESSFNPQTHMIEYTVKVTAPDTNTMDAENVVVTDTVTSGSEYIESSYKDAEVTAGTFNEMTGVWTIGTMEIGQTETLTYKMKVSSSYFSKNETKLIGNKATVTFNTDGQASASSEQACNNTLAIEKSKGILKLQGDTSYLEYTVTVTASKQNTTDMPNVTVEDVFGKNKSAIQSYQNVTVSQGTCTTDASTATLNWNIGTMARGQVVTLTYQAVIKPETWIGTTDNNTSVSVDIENNATVKSDGVSYDSVTRNTTTLKKEWIEKVADVYNNGESITFTIKANSDKSNAPLLSNIMTFTDSMSGSYQYTGNLTVNCYTSSSNKTPVKTQTIPIKDILQDTEEGTGWTLDLTDYPDLQGQYYYELTYTVVPDDSGIKAINNSAGIGIHSGGAVVWHKSSYSESLGGSVKLTKSYVSGNADERPLWRTTIKTALPAGAIYNDWIDNVYRDYHLFTEEDLNGIVIKLGDEIFTDWTLTKDQYRDTGKYYQFHITFPNGVPDIQEGTRELTIEYHSTLYNVRSEYLKLVENYCNMTIFGANVSEDRSCVAYYKANSMLKTAEKNLDSDGNIVWDVVVNEGSRISGDATLVETLPAGLSFDSAEITAWGSNNAKSAAIDQEHITTVRNDDGTTTVRIPITGLYQDSYNVPKNNAVSYKNYDSSKINKTSDGRITVKVRTKVEDTESLLKVGSTQSDGSTFTMSFTNTATTEVNGKTVGSATATKELTKPMLTKDGEYNENTFPYVKYTVSLNPEGVDLLKYGTTITMTDKMSSLLRLAIEKKDYFTVTSGGKDITDQCTLVDNTNGGESEPSFQVTVPDNCPVTITYYAAVNGIESSFTSVSNEIYFEGCGSIPPTEDEESFYIQHSSASFTQDTRFTILKIDQSRNPIQGATFVLKKVQLDASGKAVTDSDGLPVLEDVTAADDEGKAVSMTTDSDGKITLPNLNMSDIYCYLETSAPAGYVFTSETAATRHYIEFTDHPNSGISDVTGITNDAVVPVINEYDGASYQILVKKLLNGSETSTNKQEFSFTLEAIEDPMPKVSLSGGSNILTSYTAQSCAAGTEFTSGTATVKGAGTTTFDRLYFNKVGTYYFTLTENDLDSSLKGYTKDGTVYQIEITVAKKANNGLEVQRAIYRKSGELIATYLSSSAPTFDNTYSASGSLTLNATKQLTGGRTKDITDGEFKFTVTENGKKVTTGSVQASSERDENGTITAGIVFEPINYTQDDIGTHTYLILENAGTNQGITYSSDAAVVTVTVTDHGDGTLDIDAKYPDDGAVFVNEYNAIGQLELQGMKTVMERAEKVAENEFTFRVMEDGAQVATGYTMEGGIIKFTEITYYQMDIGTHTYRIIENKGTSTDSHVKYTADPVTVTVEVKDAGGGKLEATPSYPDGVAVFYNEYEAFGTLELTGTKILTGNRKKRIEDNEFTFTVKELGKDVLSKTDSVTIGTVSAETQEGEDGDENPVGDQSVTIRFEPIYYTADDIGYHEYLIAEDDWSNVDPTITYDPSSIYLKVKVYDAGDGKLETKIVTQPDDGITFTNKYNATGSIELTATKKLENRTKPIQADEFNFTVTDENGKTVSTGATNAGTETVPSTATVTFTPISYTQDEIGTHTYTIREDSGKNTTIKYNAPAVTVTVTVEDDGDGKLKATASYPEGGAVFTNEYDGNAEVTLTGKKELSSLRKEEIQKDEFAFSVKEVKADEEGTETKTEVATGTTLTGGTIEFTTIKYDAKDIGTHTYEVSENVPADEKKDSAITYSTETKIVTVVVSDDEDGVLHANVTYPDGGLTFTNDYQASGSLTLTGIKELKGNRAAAIGDGEFSFTVKEGSKVVANGRTVSAATEKAESGQTQSDGETAEAKGTDEESAVFVDGIQTATVKFDTINYTAADIGTHTYVISEDKDTDKSITYTEETVTITVVVSDLGDGKLEAKITDQPTGGIKFINQYNAKGEITLAATKEITGRDAAITDSEFRFEVLEGTTVKANGQTNGQSAEGMITTVKPEDGSGTIQTSTIGFDTIEYTQDDIGTHTYVITEIAGDDVSIGYDAPAVEVTVVVSDKGSGELDVTATYPEGGAKFVNQYLANGTIELTAMKELAGNRATAIQDGEFTFKVYEVSKSELPTDHADTDTAAADAASASADESAADAASASADESVADDASADTSADLVATGSTQEGGKIVFSEIKYETKDIGTHYYKITEDQVSYSGTVDSTIHYTSDPVYVTVKVTDGGKSPDTGEAILNVEIDYPNGGAKFVNDYQASADLTLLGNKTVQGRAKSVGDDEFQFVVNEIDADGQVIKEEVTTGATKATAEAQQGEDGGSDETTGQENAQIGGNIEFQSIHYTQEDIGTHTYVISEVIPETRDNTIDYSASSVTVKVTVSDENGDGTLTTKVEYPKDAAQAEFVNQYAASGSLELKAVKKLTGNRANPITEKEFTFIVKENGKEIAAGYTLDHTDSDAAGTAAIYFPTIQYSTADIGTHEYEIIEEVPDTPDSTIKYNAEPVYITVVVSDDGDGKLKVESSAVTKTYEFVNDYIADGEVELSATKVVSDRAAEVDGGEFTFSIREVGTVSSTGEVTYQDITYKDGPQENEQTAKAVVGYTLKGGNIEFPEIQYTQDDIGIHTYEITENEPEEKDSTITYSAEKYIVTVKVTDGGNGHLNAEPTYPEGGVKFTNTYKAEGSITLSATKKLTGQRAAKIGEGEFTFTVKEIGEAGSYLDESKTAATGKTKESDTTENEGKVRLADVEFTEIKYTTQDIGIHRYEIREDILKDSSIKYTEIPVIVTVEVTDAGNGHLNAVAAYQGGKAVFTNEYQASGDVTLEAEKLLTGNRAAEIADNEFSFVVKENGQEVAAGTTIAGGTVVFTEIKEEDSSADEPTEGNAAEGNTAEGNVTDEVSESKMPTITYTQDDIGLHSYVISEIAGTEGSIGYVAKPVTVTVEVRDGGNGHLTTEVKYPENQEKAIFTNAYYAVGEVQLEATKVVNGNRAKIVGDGEFTFKVYEGEKLITTGATAAGGRIVFDEIRYTQDDIGEHTYSIAEDPVTDNSISYAEPVSLTVHVSDAGEGGLDVKVDYPAGGLKIENQYYATGSITLEGTKEMIGNREKEIGENEFTFTVLEGTEIAASGRTLSGGEIEFTEIEYDQDDIGDHEYVIREDPGDDGNITYAQSVNLTVTVSDAGGGKLNAIAAYPEGGLKFINQYSAKGSFTLSAAKILTGHRAEAIQENEFTFTVTEVIDGMEGTESVATGWTEEGGNIIFTPISYTQDDIGTTHTYVIREDLGADETIEYSAEPVTVEVTISDKGDGELNIEPKYSSQEFVNAYKAEGEIVLNAVKELTGNRAAEIKAGEFTFTVTEGGIEVATGETLDGGQVKFTEIAYTQDDVGTHTYLISEIAGEDAAIGYVAEPVTVTVTVTDAGDGKLDTVASYPEGGAKFVNEYHAAGTLVLTASKELKGSPLQDGQFTFELKDEAGEVLQTKTNDSDGLVTFDALAYTEEDIDQVYTYTVSEADGKVHGIAYSTNVYTVQVTVKDNSDGILVPETEITLDGQTVTEMAFANVFGGTVSLLKIGPDGEHLKNAKFELYQKTEDGWTLYTEDYEDGIYSTGDEGLLEVKDLSENEYYFIEAVAPEGYITAKDEDGNAAKYTFKIGLNDPDAVVDAEFEIPNDKTSVEILKQDENGKAVAGAVLRVVDEDGNKMDEWTTDGKAHEIAGVLTGGQTYRLVEVSAPEGHRIAQDIIFTVKADGPTDPVTMVDQTVVLSESGSAQLTKHLTMNGEPMAAENSTFYVALFEDAECTRRVTEIKSLDFQMTSSVSVTFDGLELGKKYYASETDANGTALSMGMIETGDFYLAVFAQGQGLTATKDEPAELSFENQFASLPNLGFYLEGELTITKQLLSSDGEPMESDETFYAGIFDDPDFENLSASVYENIVPISLGGASEASVTIPVVMPASGTITVYVTEVDERGTPVTDAADFAYEVILSETEVTLTTAMYAGAVAIINWEIPEEIETESETESETQAETEPETKVTRIEEEPETEAETPAETEAETSAETEVETLAETEAETPAETESETPAETEAETPAETTAETESETPAETESETTAETESETPAETEAETPAETEAETPAETESETTVETESEMKSETEPATQAETRQTSASQTEASNTVKTGDDTPTERYILLFAAAAITLLIIEEKRRRSKKA